jgi:hypothetical protein
MKKNLGVADRAIRTVVGLLLGFLVLNGTIEGTLAIILGILALLLLATSAMSFCPLYMALKLSTARKSEQAT